jgi:hypothetical protein
MVQPANGHGEPVADLASHRPLLRELDVVRIRWGPPTDQTRLGGNKSQMVAVALAHRLADGNDPLGVPELACPGSECGLNRSGIWCCELVFEWEGPLRPGGESLGINELLQLGDQLVSQVCGSIRRQACWLGSFPTCSPVGGLRGPAGLWLDYRLV